MVAKPHFWPGARQRSIVPVQQLRRAGANAILD
jgi:hypothetical protein